MRMFKRKMRCEVLMRRTDERKDWNAYTAFLPASHTPFSHMSILLFIPLSLILLGMLSIPVNAVSGGLTVTQSLYFTGTSTDPATLYQDGIDGNLDAGIQICDVGPRYVGVAYALNHGAWEGVLISYASSSEALAYTSQDDGNGCYSTPAGYVTISPSVLTTPSPTVLKAALPGRLYVTYAGSANPGVLTNFIYAGSAALLRGDYTFSRSFDQVSRSIQVATPTITFQTQSSVFTKSASDSSYGISNERPMVIGICDDDHGEACASGTTLTSASFPLTLASGLTASQVNDQNTYTKYVVMNGIGKPLCIGANLQASIQSIAPNPVYYSQQLTIQLKITNPRDTPYELSGGNVDVTNTFTVQVKIYNASNPNQVVHTRTFTVSNGVPVDGSVSLTDFWDAYAHSGMYTVEVTVDSGNSIAECNEADNTYTANFELKPITIPDVYIDGVYYDGLNPAYFPRPGIPYNLTVLMKNSDNDTLANATVILQETNGLSLTFPTQLYNETVGSTNITRSVHTLSQLEAQTDSQGRLELTVLPTWHPFLQDAYAYLNYTNLSGGYSFSMTGWQANNESFKFIINGTLTNIYPFLFTEENLTLTQPTGKRLPAASFVQAIYSFLYRAYLQAWYAIAG